MKILFIVMFFIININASYIAKSIKLEGLTQISPKIAHEVINIKKNDSYTDEQINIAIKKFYNFNYFNDIEVFNKNNNLLFKFTEKPFIINIDMNGYKSRDDDLKTLLEIMNIKKGNMYTKNRVNNAKKILLEQLKLEGYVHSVVETKIEKINSQSVSVVFDVNKGDEIIINKVNYVGAKSLNSSDFEELTANNEEDLVSWWFGQNDGIMQFSQIQYDSMRIQDIYFQHGFLDVKVTPAYSVIDFNTNKAEIDFHIKEGNQYKVNNIIIYLNEKIVKIKDIKENLTLKKKKTFNIKKLRKDVSYIKTQIANKGFAYTKIKYDIRKNKKTKTVDIIYNAIEGDKVYIRDVIITNNTRTLDRVIRRNVYLAPKDLFNLTDLKDSKSKLKRTGFFTNVNIKKKRINKNQMDLEVSVEEAPTGSLTFGGGYSSYDGWVLSSSINDKNIFGSGLNLGLSFEHSNKKDTATLSLKNPAINDSIYDGSFSVYKKTSIITADSNSSVGDETKKTQGFSLGIGRSINRNTRIGIVYALEDEDLSYELNSSNNSSYTTSSFTPYINFDNTDSFYVPRSGIQVGTSLKMAGAGGDAKYFQNNSYFKYYLGLEDYIDYDAIIRYKIKSSVLQDRGDITGKSFYLGGPSSLRGYKSYAFQPDDKENHPYKKALTQTIEISFPLLTKARIRWALFFDYGMIGENNFDDIKKSGYGASINWYSPVGPIQLIFSRANNPTSDDDDKISNFEFSLGNTF